MSTQCPPAAVQTHRRQPSWSGLLTSLGAVLAFGAVRGAEGAPSSADGWNHAGVGGVALDPAGLSVARLHRGAAVQRVANPRGLRTGTGEQLGSLLAALWAQSEGG